jgi:hypothetical protein
VGNYDHGFTLWSRYRDLKFTPDDPRSTCGTPYDLKATEWFMGGTGLWEYKGNAEINDRGSCWFKFSYIFWNADNGGDFGLTHSMGRWDCYLNCRVEGTVPYFVYTG